MEVCTIALAVVPQWYSPLNTVMSFLLGSSTYVAGYIDIVEDSCSASVYSLLGPTWLLLLRAFKIRDRP